MILGVKDSQRFEYWIRLSVKFNTPGMPGYDMTEDNGTPFQIYKHENG